MSVAHPLNAGEQRQPLAVFRFGEDENRTDLGDGLGEDRRRHHRAPLRPLPQIALVVRHVLDADDPLVFFELGDPIDEQERITMRKDPLDGGVVERQRQVHAIVRLYFGLTDCRSLV